MELSEARGQVEKIEQAINGFRGSLDLDQLNEDISVNEAKMTEPGFWDDQRKAQKLIDENNRLKLKYDNFNSLVKKVDDLKVNLELLEESDDADLEKEFNDELSETQKELDSYRLSLLLNGKYDENNAIVEIHPGAGGTESQDWGSMLFRMYERWAEQNGFSVSVEDYQPGDVAGINSVTFLVTGLNAYGYLKSEKGVHRLVRISPFDSAGRRHTSFASVDVMPELDETVSVDINPEDLRVDVFRSSGAGGQHINKTSSAVRITHLPTGIVTSSQAQRSQLQNRVTAMNMLKSKLYEREQEKKEAEKAKIEGKQLDIGWGSQIRSYVFHPYTMVKDHRTNYETGNGQAVMDGDLNPFINAYLQWNLKQKNPK
ncbi:peptide chain release factor 2 [Fructilactobacillus fructivorans]|uniref:Peptide chain release factor 2 n=1 Tax=Fructilactobacillus fructivorans TaxID=1614 RepID=A0AAE6TX81_9LACO|nr:peptide chain release factor 2 [Fructilactobacillus fructivorans]QFX92983.1 peptide chain release factor 2 [Fructilactobacillus fructivorans]RDV65414.1 peptide chain release factor 2 [Fructilactobacillus fructivorans]